ncbi:adenosine deaminase/editase [Aspergillus varians]
MGDSVPGSDPLPSRVAALVHAHFDGLPKRSKPIVRADGTAEWIPMTGIVLVKGENTPSETLSCVAVTTGAKCLPASQIPNCNGLVLHDCHAEILALRAFNFWLLSECRAVLAHEERDHPPENNSRDRPASPYIWRRQPLKPSDPALPPFELYPDVGIYMYCTCAPCGDASMELVMAAQDDPTPWALPNTTTEPKLETQSEPPSAGSLDASNSNPALLDGRGHFSKLGIVRRKPARADAESTKSKSCSDKLSLRQVTSALSYEASLLVAVTENAYIRGVVLPEEEISRVGCARCFGGEGRMSALNGRGWSIITTSTSSSGLDGQDCNRHRYEFRPFSILSIPNTQLKALWPFRKPKASDPDPGEDEGGNKNETPRPKTKNSKPGNISAIWVRAPTMEHETPSANAADNGRKNLPVLRGSKTGLFENIINGVKQGYRAASPGVRGASALSRANMVGHWRDVLRATCEFPGYHEIAFCSENGLRESRSTGVMSTQRALTYRQFKKEPELLTPCIKARKDAMRAAKEVLGGWVPNLGDEDWGWGPDSLVDSGNRPVDAKKGDTDSRKRKR